MTALTQGEFSMAFRKLSPSSWSSQPSELPSFAGSDFSVM